MERIWKTQASVEQLRERGKNTLSEHLGIEFLEIGDDYLKARMPVDHRTKQPAGLLHGGASVALAETMGSMAAVLCLDGERKAVVGVEVNANHLRPVTHGWVTGMAKPLHIGISLQVWEIRIFNERDQLTCVSRLTVATRAKEPNV